MSRRVDARDVLDADATTSHALTGRVVGAYRRRGPNAWDEAEGSIFRMRRKGEVTLVKWTPERGEGGAGADLSARFLESRVRPDPTQDGSVIL